MRLLSICAGLFFLTTTALGFGKPEHSGVVIDTANISGGKQFTLKIKAMNNMVINFDAPWKLEIKGHEGLGLTKASYAKEDMDEKLPGFLVQSTPENPKGTLEYSLTAFVCTKDKTQCFREVHSGKQDWTK